MPGQTEAEGFGVGSQSYDTNMGKGIPRQFGPFGLGGSLRRAS
jgi:hypothetical protein